MIPLTVVVSFLEWINFRQPLTWTSYIGCAYLSSGVAVTTTMPLAMPVHTKHHIPIQLFVVTTMIFVQVPSFCSVVESKPYVHKYILGSWQALSRGAWAILDAMYINHTGEVIVSDVSMACTHMYTCVHVIFGLFASTYVLWALEYQSRAFYLRRLAHGASDDESARWAPLRLSSQICHIGLLVLLFAICWEGLWRILVCMERRGFMLRDGSVIGNCPSDAQ